jgi:hypothetical protein
MGLMDKFFGKRVAVETRGNGSTQFAESHSRLPDETVKSRNATRRDLVRVVLRETMRRHSIPSDWVDCRALSVVTHEKKTGMHVQFIVRKADQQLLPYVHAFQESFREQVLKTDPAARDWLFSVGWEFYEKAVQGFSPIPGTAVWDKGGDTDAASGDTQPPEETEEELASDLERLHTLMSAPAELKGQLPEPEPRSHKPVA